MSVRKLRHRVTWLDLALLWYRDLEIRCAGRVVSVAL
jgi:hypothetical protein